MVRGGQAPFRFGEIVDGDYFIDREQKPRRWLTTFATA